MTREKWLKRIFWAVVALTFVGAISIYRVLLHFYPPLETILIIENRTNNPINVLSLSHDGKNLTANLYFTPINIFSDLYPSQDEVEVRLLFKRTETAKPETYSFTAKQGEYFERCAFQILILPEGAEMNGCYHLQ